MSGIGPALAEIWRRFLDTPPVLGDDIALAMAPREYQRMLGAVDRHAD